MGKIPPVTPFRPRDADEPPGAGGEPGQHPPNAGQVSSGWGRLGNTTPTDARSRRIRASRKGGYLRPE
jgi:hypothetical protein